MRIRAKIGGELNMHGPGVHWIHKAGTERDFPEETGKKILTNDNYEEVNARQPVQKEKDYLEDLTVKKKHPGKKEKKHSEVSKE